MIKEKDTNLLVTFNHSESLTLTKYEDGSSKCTLEITNISQSKKNVAFKIKTTSPKLFIVSPP